MFRNSLRSAIKYLKWDIFSCVLLKVCRIEYNQNITLASGNQKLSYDIVLSICLETLLHKSFANRSPSRKTTQMVKENDALGAGCLLLWMQDDNVAS